MSESKVENRDVRMQVTLAGARGFCTGVRRAVGILSDLLTKQAPPVYVYHEIVHNKRVVEFFRSRGVLFVESLSEVPRGSTILFSAHGVSPEIVRAANDQGLVTVDATCPLVAEIHHRACVFAAEGYRLILIGHRGHDEVIGTLGEAPSQMVLVSSVDDVDQLTLPSDCKLTCLVQTTFLATEYQKIVERIQTRYPQLELRDGFGLCPATRLRQDALRKIDFPCDLVLVIGSVNSSNTRRLAETARELGLTARLIDSADELESISFNDIHNVFITAGASAPEEIVQNCVNWLVDRFGAVVAEQPR